MNRWTALDAAGDYLTKATLGITGWYCLRVHIDGSVRHLNFIVTNNDIGVPRVAILYKNKLAITVNSIHRRYY